MDLSYFFKFQILEEKHQKNSIFSPRPILTHEMGTPSLQIAAVCTSVVLLGEEPLMKSIILGYPFRRLQRVFDTKNMRNKLFSNYYKFKKILEIKISKIKNFIFRVIRLNISSPFKKHY